MPYFGQDMMKEAHIEQSIDFVAEVRRDREHHKTLIRKKMYENNIQNIKKSIGKIPKTENA